MIKREAKVSRSKLTHRVNVDLPRQSLPLYFKDN